MKTKRKSEKSEKWETLDISEPAEKLNLPPFNAKVRHGDLEYHAVGTRLDILGMRNVPYIGMVVVKGEEVVNKRLEMDEHAHKFLVAEGLPEPAAKALVALAAALRT